MVHLTTPVIKLDMSRDDLYRFARVVYTYSTFVTVVLVVYTLNYTLLAGVRQK